MGEPSGGSGAPVPAYGTASLADLTPSLLAALGVAGEPNMLGLPPSPRACLLLVDGLGARLLDDNRDTAPFLSHLAGVQGPAGSAGGRTLSAGFPATTATSFGSFGTGLPPAAHGLMGLRVAVPGRGRLLNLLHWDKTVDPYEWQPWPTVFERADAGGVAASYVAPGGLRDSGLTKAVLRGSRYLAADSLGELVAGAKWALHEERRSFVWVYYADLDATGHRKGCRSEAWKYQLAHVDRLAGQLAAALPPDATLYVTADHGMVDVDPDNCVDVEKTPGLRDGVMFLGGEARARHVYTKPGAAADVLATWRGLLGEDMWVVAREQAVAEGWFGPRVPGDMLARIGDVVAASAGEMAVVASKAEPHESRLVGHHGSMTADEQLVPLLASGGGAR